MVFQGIRVKLDLMNTPLNTLPGFEELSRRARRVLEWVDVGKLPAKNVRLVRNCGEKTLAEIRTFFDAHRLHFKDYIPSASDATARLFYFDIINPW